jgi:hypothetical protein
MSPSVTTMEVTAIETATAAETATATAKCQIYCFKILGVK